MVTLEENINKLDDESLIVYSLIAYVLEECQDDEITRGLKGALKRRIKSGKNIEPELRN